MANIGATHQVDRSCQLPWF